MGYRTNVTKIGPPIPPPTGFLGAFVSATLRGVEDAYRAAQVQTAYSTQVVITTLSLPTGSIGIPYSYQLQAQGGTLPYTWALIGGTLPLGLGFNSSTGVISGTPTNDANASLIFQVTDFVGRVSVPADFSLAISGTLGAFIYVGEQPQCM